MALTTAPDPRPRLVDRARHVRRGLRRPGTVTVRIGAASARLDRRSVIVSIVAASVVAVGLVWSVSTGDFPIPMGDVVRELTGLGGDSSSEFIIRTLRLPRALTAVLVGAALGISGQIFQRMVHNPLASPDILGVSSGAAAAAVFAIVVVSASSATVTSFVLVGSVLTVGAIYLLAIKKGLSSYRLVLIGIGITAMLDAVVAYLLTRAELYDAERATVWLTGSLNGRGWEYVRPLSLALAVLVPLALTSSRQLRTLELGDDCAKGLGVGLRRSKLTLSLAGAGLAAVATAAAGPVGFVALVAPQIARRVAGERSVGLIPAGLIGAGIMIYADLVARRLFSPTELPVGVVTAIIGAPYLLWLLARANRIGSGGLIVADPIDSPSPLAAEHLRLGYDDRVVVDDLTVEIPAGRITVIVGPNACGKSTLLRALARLLTPRSGTVLLDGQEIRRMPTRTVAQRLGILPQQPISPDGIVVTDLVARGRHPHQRWFRQWSSEDQAAVEHALEVTGVVDLADRSVDELSGGQRQRVWIAMALAQGTDILLLDEPTTFLDLAHQIDVLDLLSDLNADGRTIVCVLHDLNLACRYAHHLVAMKDGAIVAEGNPSEVVTAASVEAVFGLDARVIPDPVSGTPLILPIGRHHRPRVADEPPGSSSPATSRPPSGVDRV